MELVVFNKKNSSFKAGEPVIRVNAKTGLITFSKVAVNQLGLKIGDRIEFAHDKNSKRDWFFFKNNHPDAFELVDSKGNSGLKFNNSNTAKAIIEGMGIEGVGAGFRYTAAPQIIGDFSCHLIIAKSAYGIKKAD